MAENGSTATKVITGEVRLSYAHLFEPKAGNEGPPKFSVCLLVPKSDKATYRKLKAAEKAATEAGKSSKWDNKIPKNMKASIIKDGDEDADLDKNPEFEGHWYLTVSKDPKYGRVGVVDKNVQPILDSTEVYSGCYARVSINAFPYGGGKTGYTPGVSFGLNNVQKLRDGESFGGSARAEDEFDAWEDDYEDDDEGVL